MENIHPLLTIEMADGQQMQFHLYPEYAPNTCANFIDLAQHGYFDGLTFHRVVKDYVIQGGSSTNQCVGDEPGFTIVGEFSTNNISNPLSHKRGALSMARDDQPDSAATQFFVVHQDALQLDGRYAAFGQLVSGFETLDAIATVPTLPKEQENRPLQPQIIRKITVDLNGYAPPKPLRIKTD